jgi:hypothetical protein
MSKVQEVRTLDPRWLCREADDFVRNTFVQGLTLVIYDFI